MKIIKNLFSRLWLVIVIILSYYVFKIRNRVKIYGKNNIPSNSAGILFVANHQTLIDSFVIGISIVSLFDIIFRYNRIPWNAPDSKNFFSTNIGRLLMSLSKTVPSHRRATRIETINHDLGIFKKILQSGSLLLFFEGTRTRNGEVGDCNYGVAELIRSVRPRLVIPIRLDGLQRIMPIESGFNFTKIHGGNRGKITFGQPINFSDPCDLKKIKVEIKEAVRGLSD